MAKSTYVKGSKGSKPTPTVIPAQPLPPYINTVDVTPFKNPTGKK
jgi:hypothetical protein